MPDEATREPAADAPPVTMGAPAPIHPAIVIDLGKRRRKHVKALRKGKPGKLMDKVNEVIAGLRADGTITGAAQPIVVVVTERSRGLLDLG